MKGTEELTGLSRKSDSATCKPLLDVATPAIFRVNAFRITGLSVDATTREITKHAGKLKMMEELGEGQSLHTSAFALKNPPTLDQIRDAIQRLKDPEQRIVDEFFWFWPREFGKSASDPALQAIDAGDADKALEIWTPLETSPEDGVVAMHNIAVLWHLLALEWENHYSKAGEFPEEKRRETERFWRGAFKRWEMLAEDGYFWEKVGTRVKQLDDPRLTSGFIRRMQATLPMALDKVNAELAMRYAESGRIDLAQMHVQFMRETHAGLDNLRKTAELVLAPATTRLKQQIQRAKDRGAENPKDTIHAARELLDYATRAFPLFDLFLGSDDEANNELSDEVATVCNRLQLDYHKATGDNPSCLAILRATLPFAKSADLRELIAKNISITLENSELRTVRDLCEAAYKVVEANPAAGEKEAQRLLAEAASLVPKLVVNDVPQNVIDQAKNEIALALMGCAVAYGNKTDKWQACIPILEQALRLATGREMKERITKNLETVRRNHALYGNLSPISSAPRLSTTNGIGFTLYGCTDKDAASGSYLATYYFAFFWIPIFPICRYRVIPIGGGYRFLGKAPLRGFDRLHLAISVSLVIAFVVMMNYGNSAPSRGSRRSPYAAPRDVAPSAPSSSTYTPSPSRDETPGSTYRVPRSMTWELDSDREAVEVAKLEASVHAAKIEALAREIEQDRTYLDRSDRSAVDKFNRKVNRYNLLLERQRALDRNVNDMVNSYNAKLQHYGR